MVYALNATELAELGIKGLPKTRQAIEHRAKKESWPFIEIKASGRNGRLKKYLVASLPLDIQTAIKEKTAADLLEQSRDTAVAVKPPHTQPALIPEEAAGLLTDKQRECAYARMALVAEVLKMHRVAGLSISRSQAYVLEQFETGRLPPELAELIALANARSGGAAKLSMRSLKDWTAKFRAADTPLARLTALAPKPTRQEAPIAGYVWLADFMRFHCIPSAPKLAHSYALFRDWYLADKSRPVNDLPSESQVRRVWDKLPPMVRERGRKTGAALKSLQPYVKRNWDKLKPNDVWIGDGHSFKAKVAHPVHGRPFKPEVTVILDGCTRCVMGFSVSLAESCVAVADALRIGMTHFGVPLIYYSDNGSGQTGKTIDHEITGLAARLGICHETGIAGNPQGRGIIERWWQDNLIRLARGYETFTGSGMDSSTKNLTYRKLESAFNALEKGKELSEEQQRYLKKLPSWKQFMADVARCVDEYNRRPHGELPKKADGSRFAPLEYREYRLRSDGLTPDFLAREELDTLFRPQEIRTVQRGWLDLFGNSYFSADLGAYNGDKVRVAYDWSDARSVLVYDMAGKLLAKALLDGNKHDAFPTTRLEQLAEQRRKGRVKRAQQVVKLANAEANPALEMAQDYDALMGFSGGLEQVLQPVQKAAEKTRRPALKTGTDDEWDGDIY